MDIRLVTSNANKILETQKILSASRINLKPVDIKIEELQTKDEKKLIRDKVLKAFARIGKPVFVEHTGLYIEYMNGFPGGLTQIFWDNLNADKFSEIIGNLPNTKTFAKTTIGYCDGKKVHYFDGEVKGEIIDTPKGKRDFQWDCVFVPDGHKETFAEMGDKKNSISMRKLALEKFSKFIG